ncbi:MAG: PAS domain S-box protein, partial [Planctomycetes bacterium]|nr:PAS domain S-box protein [Planctomycetota bacterium]
MNTSRIDAPAPGAESPPLGSRRSLKRTLLLWFLATSLIPLTVVSAVSYYTAKESLRDDTHESLSATVAERAAFIDNWFHYRLIDLESQATNISNARFLEELSVAFEVGGKSLGTFVKSYRWNAIVNERGEDLKTFRKLYEYYDVFLIDAAGNILFTVAGEDDLGTNLFDGLFAETRFAAICHNTLDTGRPAFSDLERYSASDNAVAGFFTSVIVDEDGEKIGVFAIQITPEQIEYAMRETSADDRGLQVYVVGYSHEEDGVTLRTELRMGGMAEAAAQSRVSQDGGSANYLSQRVDTKQTQLWMEEHGPDGTEHMEMDEHSLIYDGPNGERVLGIHKAVHAADVHWGVIAEIPVGVAFASANSLQTLVIGLVLVTFMLVATIATVTTRRIVRPIMQLSEGAERIAQGDLTQRINIEAKNEIGDLAACFNWMVSSLSRLFGDLKARSEELEEHAEKLRIATEASAESEAYTRAILDSAPDAIITIDAAGVVREFNPAAERIFGFKSAEIIGHNLTRVMPPSFRSLHEQGLARYMNTGEARILRQTVEVQGLRNDGTTFPLELTVDEIGHSNRQLFTAIARDITARKKMEEEFRQTNARLEEQTARAGNMVANLHEAAIHQEKQEWFQTGQTELTNRMRGGQEIPALVRNIITFVAKYVGVQMGAFYIPDASGCFKLSG